MPIAPTQGSSTGGPGSDGWTTSTDTWVFASATTFTVAGVNRTTQLAPGTLIRLTQTTAKYFVVVASAFGTDTTVTVAAGTDYSLANAAITSPSYSYQAAPQGWPTWFNFNEATTGITSATVNVARFTVQGRNVLVQYNVAGTSNATSKTFTLPITTASTPAAALFPCGFAKDNNVTLTTPARLALANSSATATLGKDMAGANWTNALAWQAAVDFFYQF